MIGSLPLLVGLIASRRRLVSLQVHGLCDEPAQLRARVFELEELDLGGDLKVSDEAF